jgi:signal transduction histidine kinase
MAGFSPKPRAERDVTRIILMTLFFLFHFMLMSRPLFYKERLMEEATELSSLFPIFNLLIIGFWFSLEVFEFLVWNYTWPNMRYRAGITLLRCVPVVIFVAVFPQSILSVMTLVAPLLTFYFSLVVKSIWQYGVTTFFCIAQVLLFYWASSRPIPPKSDEQYEVVILLYQLMSIILMFLFSKFWKKDRENRERQAALTAEIQANQKVLKKYASRVSRVVTLEERTRIARDIHDSLGHTLTAVSIQLNKAEAFFEKAPEVSMTAITDARSSMHEAMLDIRSTLDTLNDQSEGFDLFTQVLKPLASLSQAGIRVRHNFSGSAEGYNIAVLFALYRFVQEGATNILKHAEAHEASLVLRLEGWEGYAELRDDGKGFDPKAIDGDGGSALGYGLTGLTDRISLVRGTFSVESAPGRGTILKTRIPKDPIALIGKEIVDVIDR